MMFRIRPLISQTRIILHIRSSLPQIASISCRPALSSAYLNPREREPCPPPPPPPPPPPRDNRLFWGLMTVAVLTGILTVMAKDNKELRDWMSIHAPWFDDLIAIVHNEDDTLRSKRDLLEQYLRRQYCLYFMQRPEPPPSPAAHDSCCKPISNETGAIDVAEAEDGKPCEVTAQLRSYSIKPTGVSTPVGFMLDARGVPFKGEPRIPSPCDNLPLPIETKDICEVECCVNELGESALNNYMTASAACKYYNEVVEEALENFTVKKLRQLPDDMKERLELTAKHSRDGRDDSRKLGELACYFKSDLPVPSEDLKKGEALLQEYQERIKRARIEYEWAEDMSKALDDKWQTMSSLVKNFMHQMEIMYPGLDFDAQKGVVEGDMDLLVYQAFKQLKAKQQELADVSSAMSQRVDRAYESLPSGDKAVVAKREADLAASVAQKRAAMAKSYADRLARQKKDNQAELQAALQKRADSSMADVAQKVAEKEKEACAKLIKMVEEKVASEKQMMDQQRKELKGQVKLIEAKLCDHLKAESESRRSQELWTCGASLMAATKRGEPIVNVDKEIKAIEKAAGEDDKLVLAVLKAIPDSVKKEGVVPESVLRERYHAMEQVALNVAMVESEGSSLPVYFLSWVQAMFLFMKLSCVPKDELVPPKEPPESLDTFDLLQRARYWISEGRLEVATRYVGALKGASRVAADSWYEAAKAHLETRQAAAAVLAHAQALAVQYI